MLGCTSIILRGTPYQSMLFSREADYVSLSDGIDENDTFTTAEPVSIVRGTDTLSAKDFILSLSEEELLECDRYVEDGETTYLLRVGDGSVKAV